MSARPATRALTQVLADAFIKDSVAGGAEPFQVAWYKSDTTYSITSLETGLLDVAITYSPAAEQIAIARGIAAAPAHYAFRDHFLFVGPPANPARVNAADDIATIFSALHTAAEGNATEPPVRFLSRHDKSATNIKEVLLWAGIGQVGARPARSRQTRRGRRERAAADPHPR